MSTEKETKADAIAASSISQFVELGRNFLEQFEKNPVQKDSASLLYMSRMLSLVSSIYKQGWEDCEKHYTKHAKNN